MRKIPESYQWTPASAAVASLTASIVPVPPASASCAAVSCCAAAAVASFIRPVFGRLASRMPKAMGTSKSGSNFLTMAR